MNAVVGFTGPRDLAGRWQPLVSGVVGAAVTSGASLVVGDAAGLDAFVSQAVESVAFTRRFAGLSAPALTVFSPPDEAQFCPVFCRLSPVPGQGFVCTPPVEPVRPGQQPEAPLPGESQVAFFARQARVVTLGGRTPGALVSRSVRMVQAVAAGGAGSSLVGFVTSPCPVEKRRGGGQPLAPSASSSRCFSGYGSGTWASLAFAAGLGLPVVVFACGIAPAEALPAWWGRWVIAGTAFPWAQGWRLVGGAQ